jgi:hypothetical protein
LAAAIELLMRGKEDQVMPCRHTVEAAPRLCDLDGGVTADVVPFPGHRVLAATGFLPCG